MSGNATDEFSTGDPRVDAALRRLNGKFKDLEDALIVQAHLERKQSETLVSHDEWLQRHQHTMNAHNLLMKEIEESSTL